MTWEEAIVDIRDNIKPVVGGISLDMAIQALEQESKAVQFAKWVATEIFDENWEYNKDSFVEITCRKLAKLGIIRAKGDEWELVESPESEGYVTRSERTLSKAVKMLTDEYIKALAQESVRKPMAYALYQTWSYFDQHEKSRLAERSEEDGKEET